MNNKNKNKILNEIADLSNVNVEDLKPSTNLQVDLRLDSLDMVELAMTLEEEFNIEISDSDYIEIKTIKDIINYIDNKTRK